MNTNNFDCAIYVGRFCPIHKGHESIICEMLSTYGVNKSLLVIGSANRKRSFNHMFSFNERYDMITRICPSVMKTFIDDYDDDEKWILTLYKKICSSFKVDNLSKITFFGGCQDDVWYLKLFKTLLGKDINMILIDRKGLPISATYVREYLLDGKSIHGMVNPLIENDVLYYFNKLNKDEIRNL